MSHPEPDDRNLSTLTAYLLAIASPIARPGDVLRCDVHWVTEMHVMILLLSPAASMKFVVGRNGRNAECFRTLGKAFAASHRLIPHNCVLDIQVRRPTARATEVIRRGPPSRDCASRQEDADA